MHFWRLLEWSYVLTILVSYVCGAITFPVAPRVHWGFAPWLVLYASGFGYVTGVSLHHAHQRRRCLAMRTKSAAGRVERIPRDGRDRIRVGCPGRDR